jgi:hypothetical protein
VDFPFIVKKADRKPSAAYGFLAKTHVAHEVAGEAQVANHAAQIDDRSKLQRRI